MGDRLAPPVSLGLGCQLFGSLRVEGRGHRPRAAARLDG
jgi:hypothetical protein